MKTKIVFRAAILLFFVYASSYAQGDLIAFYPFNGNAQDASGNGHHGIVNGATLTFDRFNNPDSAFAFDGVDDFIDIPYHPNFYPSSMTASAWVKLSGTPVEGAYILTNSGDVHTPPYDPFRLRVKLSRRVETRFEGNFDSVHAEIKGKSQLMVDKWYFVAASYNEFSGTVSLYVNGLPEADSSVQMALDSNQLGLRIGAAQIFNGNTDSTGFFKGCIDDVRIYNRALSDLEIETLYNNSKPPVGISGEPQENISGFALYQNYPNPFNPSTYLRFRISDLGFVNLEVFDVAGGKVTTLMHTKLPAGEYEVEWNGRDDAGQEVGSGIYFYRLKFGEHVVKTRRMVLLR